MKHKGKLVRWNEDRGFGFLKSGNVNADVFVHISELKHMSRPPVVGDTIYFDIVSDGKGKTKAVRCKIEGVTERERPLRRRSKKTNNTALSFVDVIILMAVVGVAYVSFPYLAKPFEESLPVSLVDEDFSDFRCEGKQYCSQMSSCKEARFYLKSCPNVQIDGNNDGVPCESQWCN